MRHLDRWLHELRFWNLRHRFVVTYVIWGAVLIPLVMWGFW